MWSKIRLNVRHRSSEIQASIHSTSGVFIPKEKSRSRVWPLEWVGPVRACDKLKDSISFKNSRPKGSSGQQTWILWYYCSCYCCCCIYVCLSLSACLSLSLPLPVSLSLAQPNLDIYLEPGSARGFCLLKESFSLPLSPSACSWWELLGLCK